MTTPFTITDVDPQRAKALANTLAERYAADRLAEWRRSTEDRCQKARESAEKSRQERRENAARLETFERQQREAAQSLADASRQETPQPATIDNPVWLDLQRQVSDLERRRDQLLVDRTPLHPAVQEIEGQLADVKGQLAATSRQIPDDHGKTGGAADAPAIVAPRLDDLAAKEYQWKLGELAAALE